jgi:hypothetical protein
MILARISHLSAAGSLQEQASNAAHGRYNVIRRIQTSLDRFRRSLSEESGLDRRSCPKASVLGRIARHGRKPRDPARGVNPAADVERAHW